MSLGSHGSVEPDDAARVLSVDQTREPNRDRLVVTGELDAFSAPDLRKVVAAATSPEVALDLAGVTFIDSSGLAMIVETHQRLVASGRRLVITGRSAFVDRLLELSGVAGRLNLEPGH